MQTLIIAPPGLKPEVEQNLTHPITVKWAFELSDGFTEIEASDIDVIVYDGRSQTAEAALRELIALVPVTTRLLAIVDQLPDEDIFSESGVVYLTPPVNVTDITWFIRGYHESDYA